MNTPLIEATGLTKEYRLASGKKVHAVSDVSLQIFRGETLGLVGESGCGKSTLGRALIGLNPPTAGEVRFEGAPITGLGERAFRAYRRRMQMIFQDPYASLDPRMTVQEIVAEPLKTYKVCKTREELSARVGALLDAVGIPREYRDRYPHQFSGGQRQRVGIARAIALDPDLIVCDEPVSALDVSIQAQILNLLMDLQEQMNLTYVFITHDMSVVKHIADDICVMYLGQCVECAPADELFEKPLHPYTQALLKAIPVPRLGKEKVCTEVIHGELTSPINPKPGCRFSVRCQMRHDGRCPNEHPQLHEVSAGHYVMCSL